MKNSQRVALGGIMCALGVVFMCLGTIIPIATYACPAFAALALIPVLEECGAVAALSVYVATALLSLLFTPDREAALLYAFLGYYPVLKPKLDAGISSRPLRILIKLAIFDVAAGAVLLCCVYVFGMQALLAEYKEMSVALIVIFAVVCNITMLLYDRLYGSMTLIYRHKLRTKLFKLR